jgi:hypothetical protein
MVAAAIFALALAIGGAGVGVALSSGDGAATAEPVADRTVVIQQQRTTTDATEPRDGTETQAPETGTATTPDPPLPDADASTGSLDVEPIERLLSAYYGAVARADYDEAWSLLSPSYRDWKLGNGGRAKWRQQEGLNELYLDPSGVSVQVESYDVATQIATVSVSGMVYDAPSDPPCAYEGVTWVRRYDGRWLYDQGYVQRPARAAKWRPRRFETLGYRCQNDGY